MKIINLYDFMDLSHLILCWKVEKDGALIESGHIDDLEIAPHEERIVTLPYSVPLKAAGKYHLTLSYQLKKDMEWAQRGFEISFSQFELPGGKPERKALDKESMPRLEVCRADKEIAVEGPDFKYVFNKYYGAFTEIQYNGIKMICKMPKFNIWRAPADNDRYIMLRWMEEGYDRLDTKTYSVEIKSEDERHITICSDFSLGGFIKKPVIKGKACWTVYGTGDIILDTQVVVRDGMPFLPRFGVQLWMPEGNEVVEYFGYGPHECYTDKRRSARKGRYKAFVDHMHEDYLMPQENGSHCGTEWACITNELGMGLLFAGMDEFSFNASHYTPEDLTQAGHPHELKRRDETIVNIDYMMSGLGSNSCGPEMLPRYRLSRPVINFKLRIRPVFKEENSLFEAAGTSNLSCAKILSNTY